MGPPVRMKSDEADLRVSGDQLLHQLPQRLGALEVGRADLPEAEGGEVAEHLPEGARAVLAHVPLPDGERAQADEHQEDAPREAAGQVVPDAPLLVLVVGLEHLAHRLLQRQGDGLGRVDAHDEGRGPVRRAEEAVDRVRERRVQLQVRAEHDGVEEPGRGGDPKVEHVRLAAPDALPALLGVARPVERVEEDQHQQRHDVGQAVDHVLPEEHGAADGAGEQRQRGQQRAPGGARPARGEDGVQRGEQAERAPCRDVPRAHARQARRREQVNRGACERGGEGDRPQQKGEPEEMLSIELHSGCLRSTDVERPTV